MKWIGFFTVMIMLLFATVTANSSSLSLGKIREKYTIPALGAALINQGEVTLHIDGFNHETTPILNYKGFEKMHQSYPNHFYTYGGWIRTERLWAYGAAFAIMGSNTLNFANVWFAPKRKLGFISVTNIAYSA